MGVLERWFNRKVCAICGRPIGPLNNRRLTDGNMCRSCAEKLSPWFRDRRNSSSEQIRQQLAYREANRAAVDSFYSTRVLGKETKVLLDEVHRLFMVTPAEDITAANPDVLSISQVTGVDFTIDEHRLEDLQEDSEGGKASYSPKRYFYSYDFHVTIFVRHDYFSEMRFRLCPGEVQMGVSCPESRKTVPRMNPEYREMEELGNEIRSALG